MLDRNLFTACCVILALHLSSSVARPNNLTLRSLGAVGDGKTDDRAAIQAALIQANGSPVDGEGATYAIRGNIEINNDVNLFNATLAQTMVPVDISKYIPSAKGHGKLTVEPAEALRTMVGPLPRLHASGVASYSDDPVLSADEMKAVLPTIALRTLAITGSEEKPVSVRLENIKILRGNHPQTGSPDDGGILVDYASPVVMNDIEVTGDGKGSGISITNSSKVRLERLHVHDMKWAPYIGDNIFETIAVESVKEDFGWNNFPIYQFSPARSRFVRVRIQEQISGLSLISCDDVELLDSRVARLQTQIGERLYALQADGVTVGHVSNLTVRDCHFSEVWEGIDFTYNSGENFIYEDCTTSDTFAFGFKLAHPKRNGKMINCTSQRAGIAGFVMEPEMENIEFIRCHALETGSNGFWTMNDGRRLMTIGGFWQFSRAGEPTPFRIKFDKCIAINTVHPGAMDFGFLCDSGIDPEDHEITAIDCTAKGAKIKDFQGFAGN